LTSLHKTYKKCVNDEVTKHFADGTVPKDELCLSEKKEYYSYLHQAKKIEHDNIMRYYKDLLDNISREGI
jgi:hypothetical protein